MLQIQTLQEIIDSTPALLTMPKVISEALNLIKDPKTNVNKLSDIIAKDISLTSEILKMVNTAYYGFPTQITTINKAIALLGLNKVKSVIMSVAMKPMLQSNGGKSLWEHSIKCAVGCEIIAESLGMDDPDEAFTMGLMHDIGKIVLESYNKVAYQEINRLISLGAERLNAEKMIYGYNHAEIGAELVTKWNLPSVISTSVKYHHMPHHSEMPSVVGIVYVAERVIQDPIKYPILDFDIINSLDFDLPDPLELREIIFEKSNGIINVLLK